MEVHLWQEMVLRAMCPHDVLFKDFSFGWLKPGPVAWMPICGWGTLDLLLECVSGGGYLTLKEPSLCALLLCHCVESTDLWAVPGLNENADANAPQAVHEELL